MKYGLFIIIILVGTGLFAQKPPRIFPGATLRFSSADSVNYPRIYSDYRQRDSTYILYSNSYEQNKAIEKLALKNQNINFLVRHPGKPKWNITYTNGKSATIGPLEHSWVVDWNFEYYYEQLELIVFRTQFREGGGYKLLNRRTGELTDLFGQPIFSPSKSRFIVLNDDLISGYTVNGLAIYEIIGNEISELVTYTPDDIAPSRCKWLDENTLNVEFYHIEPTESGDFNYATSFYELKIEKNKP